jgi:hypothetical protein
MKRLAAAFLLLAGAAHGDGPAPADTSAVQAHDFAMLTEAEARRLEGKPALFRVTLDGDSDTEERGGFTCADCVGAGEPLRSLYLCPGQEAAESMTVEATLEQPRRPSSRIRPGWGGGGGSVSLPSPRSCPTPPSVGEATPALSWW